MDLVIKSLGLSAFVGFIPMKRIAQPLVSRQQLFGLICGCERPKNHPVYRLGDIVLPGSFGGCSFTKDIETLSQ